MRIEELRPDVVHKMISGDGLAIEMPPIRVRVRSPFRFFAEQIQALYGPYHVFDARAFADVDVRIVPAEGLRRWVRPQVQFVVDGVTPFELFPRSHALPMFEWGLNWVFSHRMHT